MRGECKYNGKNIDIHELTIYDILRYFRSPKDITFTPSTETKNNFMDILPSVFDEASDSGEKEDKAMIEIFLVKIPEIFKDSNNKAKLIELGATELDFALINCDLDGIKKIISEINVLNVYDLAKKLRFLPLTQKIHKEALKKEVFNLSIDNNSVNLDQLDNYAFKYCSKSNQEKTLLINIHDKGYKEWNYDNAKIWHDDIAPYFDTVITYGTGSNALLPALILKLLDKTSNACANDNSELDLVVILYSGHGEADKAGKMPLGDVINKFPIFSAHETLYLIDTCESGKYHSDWKNKYPLITSTKDSESSDASDMDNLKNLSQYINKQPDTQSFVNFFANEYKLSEPHFSGMLDGRNYNRKSVKKLSGNFNGTDLGYTPRLELIQVKEHEFAGVINLLGSDQSVAETAA